MTPIIAVDPSTACFGLAWGVGEAGAMHAPTLRRVLVLDEPSGIMQRTALERLWPALDHARDEMFTALGYGELVPLDCTISLVIERPPQAFKDDGSGRAKRQAVIGVGLGRAMELVAAWGYAQNRFTRIVDVRFVDNGAWRAWAADLARSAPSVTPWTQARARAAAASTTTAMAPVRRDGASGWVVRYLGCEHEHVCETLASLQARPSTCPTCSRPTAANKKPHPLEHKRPWVELAARLWPDAVDDVVREARAGARSAAEPYQLTGVADACDAGLLWGFIASRA